MPTTDRIATAPEDETAQVRQAWLRVLTHSDVAMLSSAWDGLEHPVQVDILGPPEIGLAMVRGRVAGVGQPFNAGEMSVTRCRVGLIDSDGKTRRDGHGLIAGRDRQKAELVAKFDALFQDSQLGKDLRASILPKLDAARSQRVADRAAKTAATKVEFFTMERGS